MPRLLLIPLLSLTQTFAADTPPQQEEFHLRATIQEIVPLREYTGAVIPIGTDPRFAVTICG